MIIKSIYALPFTFKGVEYELTYHLHAPGSNVKYECLYGYWKKDAHLKIFTNDLPGDPELAFFIKVWSVANTGVRFDKFLEYCGVA